MDRSNEKDGRVPTGVGPCRPARNERVVVRDLETGFPVVGDVVEREPGAVVVAPAGPAYPRELVAGRPLADEPDDRWYAIWDVVCLVVSGALEELPEDTLAFLANHINESHV